MIHCTDFNGIIYLDLDKIFNGTYDENKYKNNICVKKIILLRTKTTPIKIGNDFLYNCTSLATIDLSSLQNITSIGDKFLYNCTSLTTINLSSLQNITSIGNDFLYNCTSLTTIIVETTQDYLKEKFTNMNIKVIKKNKNGNIFRTYTEDIEKIKSDEQFTKNLLEYLNIYTCDTNHEYLISYLEDLKKQYNKPISCEELKKCRNDKDPITCEDLKDIPEQKLILINERNGMFDCFDVMVLRKFVFEKKKEKYVNPLTMTTINSTDLDKILSVDIKCINYFC